MAGRALAIGALVLLIGGMTSAGAGSGHVRVLADPVHGRASENDERGRHVTARVAARAQAVATPRRTEENEQLGGRPIALRPAMLADEINSLAGLSVRLTAARVVGVFNPRVFLVESDAPRSLRPLRGNRSRVLVFVQSGTLRPTPAVLVGQTVVLAGIARTILGMQVSREVSWPDSLTRESISRLDIRAALLATSVNSPEGINLLTGPPPSAP